MPQINTAFANDIDVRRALQIAAQALAKAKPGTDASKAHDWLLDILDQRGCEVYEEGCPQLTDFISVIIRG